MLIEFKVANYRSIRAEQTLSMVASNYSDELPQNLMSCDTVPGMKGTKLVKAVALYGANASGKSNIVAALRFFAEFVRDSATKLQPGVPTGAQPFKLDPACLTEPSKFEITAIINGVRTLYGLELTRERVTSEYLVAYPKGRPQVWFEREWDAEDNGYALSRSNEAFSSVRIIGEKTRENAALLSVASQFNHDKATPVWNWITSEMSFLDLGSAAPNWTLTLDQLKSREGKKRLLAAISAADIGVADVRSRRSIFSLVRQKAKSENSETALQRLGRLSRTLQGEREDRIPELLHRGVGDELFPLSFQRNESAGTRRYFGLLGHWFALLERGGALIIDELDVSLHSQLVDALLHAFFGTPKDKLAVQLIFTTHNPLLLDQTLLRRDQIWFTEKDQEGATRLYPLTDFKPRKDESLVKGYLAGRYGGIPFIPEGLKF